MEKKKILLIAIAILIIVVIGIATYSGMNMQKNVSDNAQSNSTNTGELKNNTTGNNNNTTVGDNSVLNKSDLNKTNKTYKIYDPQSDGYVTVVGEKFDNGVNRWYTYDKDGVRYYNTRISH